MVSLNTEKPKIIDLHAPAPKPAMVPGTPNDPDTYPPNKRYDRAVHKVANMPAPKPATVKGSEE